MYSFTGMWVSTYLHVYTYKHIWVGTPEQIFINIKNEIKPRFEEPTSRSATIKKTIYLIYGDPQPIAIVSKRTVKHQNTKQS